jgi:hypothetical protein
VKKNLKDLLTEDQIKEIQEMGLDEVQHFFRNREKEQVAKEKEHLNNPFYQKVKSFVNEVEHQQIIKGAKTYDEPFNPHSWKPKEILWHLLQELRDAQVYGVGLYELIESMEEELQKYKDRCRDYEAKINKDYRKEFEDAKKEIETVANLASDYGIDTAGRQLYGVVDEILEDNKALHKEMVRLRQERQNAQDAAKTSKEMYEKAQREFDLLDKAIDKQAYNCRQKVMSEFFRMREKDLGVKEVPVKKPGDNMELVLDVRESKLSWEPVDLQVKQLEGEKRMMELGNAKEMGKLEARQEELEKKTWLERQKQDGPDSRVHPNKNHDKLQP